MPAAASAAFIAVEVDVFAPTVVVEGSIGCWRLRTRWGKLVVGHPVLLATDDGGCSFVGSSSTSMVVASLNGLSSVTVGVEGRSSCRSRLG